MVLSILLCVFVVMASHHLFVLASRTQTLLLMVYKGFLWLIRIRCVNISLLIISVTILCGVRGCDGDDIDDSNGR